MDSQLAQLVVNGISIGSIIALAAVGLTLTYGILRLSNFAHGDYMTLGAYLTLFVRNLTGFSVWVSLVLGVGLTVAVILLIERLVWAPMRRQRASATTLIIISIGLALFLRNLILLIWGGENQTYGLPVAEALTIAGLRIPYNNLLVLVLAVGAIAALHYLLQNTRIGKAMRAVADDIDLARVTGINVEQVIFWTWVIAGGLTALSGGMLGLVQAVRPNMGWFLILPLFASVILGGIGNPYGAIAGAFVIGIAQEVSTYFLRTEYKLAVALIMMVLVLFLRPQGIFRGTL